MQMISAIEPQPGAGEGLPPVVAHDPDADFGPEELARQHLFRDVDIRSIEPLLYTCRVRLLAREEVLIAAGERNEHLYLLLSGRLSVRLSAADAPPLTVLEPGESVGELSMIDQQPGSAFVVAEIDSRVLAIDEEIFWMLVNTSHAVSSNLLYTLSRRMRFDNRVIRQDREQIREFRFHATVDSLTGLFNRYWLDKMLPRQMARARQAGDALSVLMLDVDHFKRFNDSHGHLAGDAALRSVAERLRESLRPTDMAARYGGEEFVVILPGGAHDVALSVAERLREHIATAAIACQDGNPLPGVTVSVGVRELGEEPTVSALLAAADAALYRAKDAGRDRVST